MMEVLIIADADCLSTAGPNGAFCSITPPEAGQNHAASSEAEPIHEAFSMI
jgi:hypothetical protein